MYDLSRVPERPPLVPRGPRRSSPGDSVGAALLGLEADTPDTNDANVYYNAGMGALHWDPAGASAAFYWASQLNPGWADPYFARWFVLRGTQRHLPDSVAKSIDSLVLFASIHDPFFDERLMMNAFSSQVRGRFMLAQRQVNAAVAAENQRRIEVGEPLLMGPRIIGIPHSWYLEFANRRFDSASRDLAQEIKKHPDALQLYVYRAKAQYYLKQYDSAAAILAAAIGRVDKKDTSRLLPVYFSREMFYYSIGIAQGEGKEDSAARVAFQNTVTENLGFYMAHLHLASQAFGRHDTTTAINEARIAAEIRPSDPLAQVFFGYSLLINGHPADAIDPLRAAIADDPYFALPYFYFGVAREAVHDTVGSLDGYRGFMAHAMRGDSLRALAQREIVRLGGT